MAITPATLSRSGTEHSEQAALFCWAAMAARHGFELANNMSSYGDKSLAKLNANVWPELRWMHAIPNGGGRSIIQASQLKAEGVKRGIPDIFLPVSKTLSSGLYIEMKRASGVPSDISKEQTEFAQFAWKEGYHWYVAFGWKQAARLVESYLLNETPWLAPHQETVQKSVRGYMA